MSRNSQQGIHLTRGQLEAWAHRPLSDDEIERLGDAIPNSSIPEAIETIVDSMSGAGGDEDL